MPHQTEVQLLKPADTPVPPVLLLLEATIPAPPDARLSQLDDRLPQILWFADEAWLYRMKQCSPCTLLPLPDGMQIPEVCYWPLVNPMPPDSTNAGELTLYLDGSANGTHAAWSVVVTLKMPDGDNVVEAFLGCTYGSVQLQPDHPDWIGAHTMDNIAAELSALAFAQNLALRWPFTHSICIRPDLSLSRLLATASTVCKSNVRLSQLCRAQGYWLAATTHIAEIRGHKGFAWNELADAVAKWTMQNAPTPARHEYDVLHALATHDHDLAWTWMQTTHPSMAACFPPLIEQQVLQVTESKHKIGVIPLDAHPSTPTPANEQPWTLQCTTANVLASDVRNKQANPTRRTSHRTTRLDQQWHQQNTHVIGVQEARTHAGKYQSQHYAIFASGATNTKTPMYGCELWIHRTLPIAYTADGSPITFGDANVVVQHADPRRLIVDVQLGSQHYTFVVLHAPCVTNPTQEQPTPWTHIHSWWKETSKIIHSQRVSDLCWVLADANAPLSDAATALVGPLGAETTNKSSEALIEFLTEHGFAVPSTFEAYHTGQTTTWTHATGKRSRKDYIFVRKSMLPLVHSSQVDVAHDTTFAHEDHVPVTLICKGWNPMAAPTDAYAWDDELLLDSNRCHEFQQALNTLPIPHWDVSIEDHAALFEKQLLQLSQQFFVKRKTKARKIHLADDTRSLIALKRQALDYGRTSGDILTPAFKHELKEIEKEVSRLVRRDTQAHYDHLLATLEEAGEMSNHRLVYRLLMRLGRKKGSKPPGPRPLPMLRKEDGSCARTYQEQQAIWLEQFSAIEAGIPVTWDQLRQANETQQSGLPPHQVEPQAFPTAWEIQERMACLKRDKVPGPNHLPPAVLKAGGEVLARQLSILFAKAAAHATEPTHWKGGRLVPLWKGKGPPDRANAYRSIFISNYSTKLYHQCIRRHLVGNWESKVKHLQCGGRRGVGTDIAHHIVQLHQQWAATSGSPTAILYLDLRSAFYMVLRQTFTSLPSNNEAFLAAMSKLGLPIDQVIATVATAEQEVAVDGLSMHLQRILHDMLSNTFFTIAGLPEPCLTTRGTRPGDPVADILFNLCMSRILTDFHERLATACTIPWLGDAQPIGDFATAAPLPSEGYIDVTFVDDCAILVHAKDNHRILQMIRPIVEAFTHAAASRGLEVNFEKGKTELLWTVIGNGARATKEMLFHASNTIKWTNENHDYSVHVCHEYKHLGTWTQTKNRHAKEINTRASSAKQQWGQLARAFGVFHQKAGPFHQNPCFSESSCDKDDVQCAHLDRDERL